jgi:hypothetical protein
VGPERQSQRPAAESRSTLAHGATGTRRRPCEFRYLDVSASYRPVETRRRYAELRRVLLPPRRFGKRLLIDEPEACPPPASSRLLGQMLATGKPAHRQLFVATHSETCSGGVLDGNPGNVRVVQFAATGT